MVRAALDRGQALGLPAVCAGWGVVEAPGSTAARRAVAAAIASATVEAGGATPVPCAARDELPWRRSRLRCRCTCQCASRSGHFGAGIVGVGQLVVDWRDHPERGMPAGAVVLIDPGRDPRPRGSLGLELLQ